MKSPSLALILFTFALALPACGPDDAPKLTGQLTLNPSEPVPNAPFSVDIEVERDGAALGGGKVILTSALDGQPRGFAIDAVEIEPGLYRAEGVTLSEEGAWSLTASVSASGASGAFTLPVEVACLADRGQGQSCCGTAQCGGGLWCDANACADTLRPDGIECDDEATCASGLCSSGLCASPWDVIGTGDGTPGSVTFEVVLTERLSRPTDLAFDPADGELWVSGRQLDQLSVVVDPMQGAGAVEHFFDRSQHFLEEVVTLSFGDSGTFATCGETRNTYNGLRPPDDFMGPVMWPADRVDFQVFGPDASNVHLDMLHNSPNCMGIEADTGNAFFVFNGHDGVLDWYDFHEPHPDREHGGENHSDGIKRRYTEVSLSRKPGVPSHMALDADRRWLYIADTGNGRVLRVDTTGATEKGRIQAFFGDGILSDFQGIVQEFVVEPGDGLISPSGLALYEGVIFVTDNATGLIHAFKTDGQEVNKLDTGLGAGALAGVEVGPDGFLYFVDMSGDRVLRVLP